jgi:hypothetical protein
MRWLTQIYAVPPVLAAAGASQDSAPATGERKALRTCHQLLLGIPDAGARSLLVIESQAIIAT